VNGSWSLHLPPDGGGKKLPHRFDAGQKSGLSAISVDMEI